MKPFGFAHGEQEQVYLTGEAQSSYARRGDLFMIDDKKDEQVLPTQAEAQSQVEQAVEKAVDGALAEADKKVQEERALEASYGKRVKAAIEWDVWLKKNKGKRKIDEGKVKEMIVQGVPPDKVPASLWLRLFGFAKDTSEEPQNLLERKQRAKSSWDKLLEEKPKEEMDSASSPQVTDEIREKANELAERGITAEEVKWVDGIPVSLEDQKIAKAVWEGLGDNPLSFTKEDIALKIAKGESVSSIVAESETPEGEEEQKKELEAVLLEGPEPPQVVEKTEAGLVKESISAKSEQKAVDQLVAKVETKEELELAAEIIEDNVLDKLTQKLRSLGRSEEDITAFIDQQKSLLKKSLADGETPEQIQHDFSQTLTNAFRTYEYELTRLKSAPETTGEEEEALEGSESPQSPEPSLITPNDSSPLSVSEAASRRHGEAITEEDVYATARLNDVDRIEKAKKVLRFDNLKDPMQLTQVNAVLAAHYVGEGVGVYNYTPEQLREKAEILQDLGEFSIQERRNLMKAGVTGTGDPSDAGSGGGGLPETEPSMRAEASVESQMNADVAAGADAEDGGSATPDNKPKAPERGGGSNQEGRSDEKNVNNIMELVREIVKNSDVGLYGVKGETTATGQPIEEDGVYPIFDSETREINQENFLRWVRDRMMYFHSDNPDDPNVSLFKEVKLERNYLKDITLGDMTNNISKYFRSPDGSKIYEDLADQVKREMWLFQNSRNMDVQYKQNMGSDAKIGDFLVQLYSNNIFTKEAWNKSTLGWVLSLPLEFQGHINKVRGGDPEGKDPSTNDVDLGAAINSGYLGYFHLTDIEKLQELFAHDSVLFNQEKMRKIRDALAEDDSKKRKFQGSPEQWITSKAITGLLDKEIGSKDFMDALNIFSGPQRNPRLNRLIRAIMKQAIVERYGLYQREKDGSIKYKRDGNKNFILDEKGNKIPDIDDATATYAENWAFSMVRWTGAAARNDTNAAGYDAWTKGIHLKTYRVKQSRSTSGGAFGNPYTTHMIKGLTMPLFEGIRTETLSKRAGTKDVYRTPMEIMEAMQKVGNDKNEVRRLAGELYFPDNTMQKFAQDQFRNSFAIFQQVIGGEEIKLEKFTHYDPLKGVTFDRGSFSSAVQEKFIKPMRYAYSTWGQLDFAKEVRALVDEVDENGRIIYDTDEDGKAKARQKYKNVPLAYSLFGRELLDLPNFWKTDFDLEEERERNAKKDGKVYKKKKIDPKKAKPLRPNKYGYHEINYEKMNSKDGKADLWKSLAKGRIATELYSHVDLYSTDPRYNFLYYETVIKALESIPGGVLGDESDFNQAKQTGHFFNKEDIKWLRKKAKIETWRIGSKAAVGALATGFGKGMWKSLKTVFESVFLK